MLCAKFGLNWPSGSGEDFLISSMYRNYFLLEKGGVLEKKIFKSCQFTFIISQLSPLWEGRGSSFEQIWTPFTQWFCRRFLKVVNLFLLFPDYLPFGKGVALHLTKLESP